MLVKGIQALDQPSNGSPWFTSLASKLALTTIAPCGLPLIHIPSPRRPLPPPPQKHQVIIKIYKQRVKHLLYEHQNEVTTAKTDSEIALKLLQDENRGKEAELKSDKRALKLEKKEVRRETWECTAGLF